MTMRLDFVFDTSAARTLGCVPENRWVAMRAVWKRHGLTTAWPPHLLGELMASNLARKGGLDVPAIREVQKAVSRMDDLATGQIEPADDDLIRQSLFDLAGESPPPPNTPTATWRRAIGLFLEVERPEQVEASRLADRLQVVTRDASLDHGVAIDFR
ncbi:MAG: hypothetical protein L6Q95_09970 [Planctomycetes bacterium]|nr:hypothetical protein [Planctomycetota bacterium]